MTQEVTSINTHEFVFTLVQRYTRFNPLDKTKELSTLDIYQKSIYQIWQDISTLYDMLKLSGVLVDKIRFKKYQINKVYNSDVLNYHLDCYFMRVTSFRDLIHKLINRVYEFGYKENLGLKNNLSKHRDNVKEVDILLKYLEVMFSELNNLRNTIAHGGSFSDQPLGMLSAGELKGIKGLEGFDNLMSDEEYKIRLRGASLYYSYVIQRSNKMIYTFLMKIALDGLYKVRVEHEKNK